jgi:hypothetical protein
MPRDIGEYFVGYRPVSSVINKKTRLRSYLCGRLRDQFLRKIIIKIACFQKLSLSPPFSGNHYRLNPGILQEGRELPAFLCSGYRPDNRFAKPSAEFAVGCNAVYVIVLLRIITCHVPYNTL